MSKKALFGVLALVLTPVLVLVGAMAGLALLGMSAMSAITGSEPESETCGAPALEVDAGLVDEDLTVAGYSGEQLQNAAEILAAGATLQISQYGQTIAVMTAMGESSLRVIDYGDAVGPDSRGLFQQRANGAWGSYSDRMNPFISSTNFYKALQQVQGWETLQPTIAAHKTQRNADPYHYTRYWESAVAVVAALTATSAPLLDVNPGDPFDTPQLADPTPALGDPAGTSSWSAIASCAAAYSGVANTSGWAHPVPGFTTFWDNYGQDRGGYTHAGEDLAAPADTPILAAAEGVVSHVSCQSWQGRSPCNILVDHGLDDQGRTVQSLYVHMYPEDVYAVTGQQVSAGEKIAGVGTNGNSTGNHLHFEIWIDGSSIDPQDFMASVGIDLTNPDATEVLAG